MKLIKRSVDNNLSNDEKNKLKLDVENHLGYEVTDLLIDLIATRGYTTTADVLEYISPSVEHDPFLFKDMEKAVNRIKQAINDKKQFVVWGDFDVDGMTSSSLLVNGFRDVGALVNFYIPTRNKEKYGLNKNGIKLIKDSGADLIVTVDCGITGHAEIKYANELGIDVIVTDHHQAAATLPEAYAIINPHTPGETYPFKELAGVGVASKLLEAVTSKEIVDQYSDLIALGTVTDMMSLHGENRTIVNKGLEKINTSPSPGIKIFLEEIFNSDNYSDNKRRTKPKEYKSSHFGFTIGPVLNSVGRLWEAKMCTLMLTTPKPDLARGIAQEAIKTNIRRRDIEGEVTQEALSMAEKQVEEFGRVPDVFVIDGKGWVGGVLGLAATTVSQKYYRPTIILNHNEEDDMLTGSARSIPGVNLHGILSNVEFMLDTWGGHEAAAGLSLERSNLDMFKETLYIEFESVDRDLFIPIVKYDKEIDMSDVTRNLVLDLKLLEPVGLGNPGPKFITKDVNLENVSVIGDGTHFKGSAFKEGFRSNFIKFNSEIPENLIKATTVYKIEINDYDNLPQLMVDEIIEKDIDSSEVEYKSKPTNVSLEQLSVQTDIAKKLNKEGIVDSKSLLEFIPRRYRDYSNTTTVQKLRARNFEKDEEEDNLHVSMIVTIDKAIVPNRNPKMTMVFAFDENKEPITIFIFGFAKMVADNINKHGDKPWIFCGKYTKNNKGDITMNPEYYSYDIHKYKKIVPVYKKIKGVSHDYMSSLTQRALGELENYDYADEEMINEFELIPYPSAIRSIHNPRTTEALEESEKRMMFDKLFKYSLSMRLADTQTSSSNNYLMTNDTLYNKVIDDLPYNLTGDQQKAVQSIRDSMNRPDRLVNGLLQGDVGSGKTIVAILLMALAYDNGYQSCLVAPTDVLAKQHYEELSEMMSKHGIEVGFLSSDVKAAERREIAKRLKNGDLQLVVGTHSLVQKSITFKNLGVAVIDEQHRFGVEQRDHLLNTDNPPHFINMSATPIPRTLSMAILGDSVEVYNIFEKPAGRKEVLTEFSNSDEEAYGKIIDQLKLGHQAYVICPLVEKSKSEMFAGLRSVDEEVKVLKAYLKDKGLNYNVEGISGKIKPEELDAAINKFSNKEIDIIVATTVVEVGVNIPNATIILIKGTERFGLSQLHQLRGRVGRSSYQSYCILQTTHNEETERSKILTSTTDGFEIATEDLKLRGTGSFLGTQQSGQDKTIELMIKYPKLYQKISGVTEEIYNNRIETNTYKSLLELT